jgi:hypothetical protein
MSAEHRDRLIVDLCRHLGVPNIQDIVEAGHLEVDGFVVSIDYFDEDDAAIYLQFAYGIVSAGRTLRIFRLLLEANLCIYAHDQAQLGIDADTGGIVLLVRVPLEDDLDGPWLAETLNHYVEHGRYWQKNILTASDEMFDNLASGSYVWLRA